MSLAHAVLDLLEQVNGSGTSTNGGSSDDTNTEEPSNDTKNNDDTKKEPEKEFHRHVLNGYGPYYCSCDKNTPKEERCPNCKTKGK